MSQGPAREHHVALALGGVTLLLIAVELGLHPRAAVVEPTAGHSAPAATAPAPPPSPAAASERVPDAGPAYGATGPAYGLSAATDSECLKGAASPAPEAVRARVTAFFRALEITDAELIEVQVLDETDRGYQQALLDADALRARGQAQRAVEALEAALAAVDRRHAIGRARLLDALAAVALEAGDLRGSASARARLQALREELAARLVRARGGKPDLEAARAALAAAGAASAQAEAHVHRLIEALGAARDLESIPARLAELSRALAKGDRR